MPLESLLWCGLNHRLNMLDGIYLKKYYDGIWQCGLVGSFLGKFLGKNLSEELCLTNKTVKKHAR